MRHLIDLPTPVGVVFVVPWKSDMSLSPSSSTPSVSPGWIPSQDGDRYRRITPTEACQLVDAVEGQSPDTIDLSQRQQLESQLIKIGIEGPEETVRTLYERINGTNPPADSTQYRGPDYLRILLEWRINLLDLAKHLKAP